MTLLLASNGNLSGRNTGLELRYGARIRVMTALKRADNFRNPGGRLHEYLERKGMTYRFRKESASRRAPG